MIWTSAEMQRQRKGLQVTVCSRTWLPEDRMKKELMWRMTFPLWAFRHPCMYFFRSRHFLCGYGTEHHTNSWSGQQSWQEPESDFRHITMMKWSYRLWWAEDWLCGMQEIITSLDVWNHRSPVRQKDGMMRRFSICAVRWSWYFLMEWTKVSASVRQQVMWRTWRHLNSSMMHIKSRWIMRSSFWSMLIMP